MKTEQIAMYAAIAIALYLILSRPATNLKDCTFDSDCGSNSSCSNGRCSR